MANLQEVEWEECLLEPRKDAELEREVRKSVGLVTPADRFLAHCPWLVRAFARNNFRNGMLVHIDVGLGELIFLAVSQDNSCRYCYASQRAALRILGFDEERIRRVEEASFSAEGEPRERLALEFARRISRSNPPPTKADRDTLREAGYTDEAIKEIAYVAAYAVMGNRASTLPALPVAWPEGLEDSWKVRLLRPFLARILRSTERPGQPEFLPPELKTGPFAYLTRELDGLPAAGASHEIFESAWSSPVLTQRAKALVIAVVARGLDSKRCENEARTLLAEHGLDEGEMDEILSHLASPKLDPIEAAIVPFARETIQFRPVDIQRRARKLLEELGVEPFVEFVGVAGLANAMCRLSLALCEA